MWKKGPVHRRRQTRVQDAFHRLHSQAELPADVGHRTMDQPLQDVLFERRGMRTARIVPGAALRRGRSSPTVGTLVALRPDFNHHITPKHWQVPQPDRSIESVKPVNFPTTAVTSSGLQGTFHLDQYRATLQHPVRQYPHIVQIQGHGQRNRHRQQSTNRDTPSAFHNSVPSTTTPLHLVAATGNLIEPLNLFPCGNRDRPGNWPNNTDLWLVLGMDTNLLKPRFLSRVNQAGFRE